MTRSRKLILTVVVTVLTAGVFATVTALRTSIPGQVVRFCLGEPGATQWVNDTADKIVSSGWTAELQEVSSRLMSEFGLVSATLPEEGFSGGRSIPLERLPLKFRELGGSYGEPDLALQTKEDGSPVALVVSWGHMRQAILIFASAPLNPPRGFFVRKVDDRIYVVANES